MGHFKKVTVAAECIMGFRRKEESRVPQLREGPSPLSSFKVHAGSPPFISESVKDVNYICKIPLALPCKIILGMISDCFCYFLWLEAKSQVLPSVKRWRLHKSVTH